MQNPINSKEWSFAKVILVIWVLFSLFYVVADVKKTIVVGIYKTGVQDGQQAGQERGVKAAAQEIIVQLINMGQRCEPINIYAGEGANRQEADLLGMQCASPGVAKPGYTIPTPPAPEEAAPEAATPPVAETPAPPVTEAPAPEAETKAPETTLSAAEQVLKDKEESKKEEETP